MRAIHVHPIELWKFVLDGRRVGLWAAAFQRSPGVLDVCTVAGGNAVSGASNQEYIATPMLDEGRELLLFNKGHIFDDAETFAQRGVPTKRKHFAMRRTPAGTLTGRRRDIVQ